MSEEPKEKPTISDVLYRHLQDGYDDACKRAEEAGEEKPNVFDILSPYQWNLLAEIIDNIKVKERKHADNQKGTTEGEND